MKPDVNEEIARLENDDPAEVLEARLRAVGWTAMTAGQIASGLAISKQEAGEIIDTLLKKGQIASYLSGGGSRFVHSDNLDRLKTAVSDAFSRYHNAHPLSGGLRRRELKDLVSGHCEDSVYEAAVESLLREGILASEGAVLRKSDHKIELSDEQEAIRDQIMSDLVKGGAAPPDLVDLTSKHADGTVDAIVEAMRAVGDLVWLDDGLVFAPQVLSDIETKIVTFLEDRGEMGVGDLRDLVGTTRKYAVPLLNYFDSNGLTERQGDVRILQSRGQ
jgi:selenocysteine-specific elongation factor